MAKRLFDLTVSSVGIPVLSPLLVVIALLIKLGSRGPALYRGIRVGRLGKPFKMYKFRTMVVEADKKGGPSTAGDDLRLTKVGKLVRKYKLDELPQLLNVLKGEMSLVGPRPEVPMYVDMFTDEEKAILRVRPGMTDWASLWNIDEGSILAGSPDPEKTYVDKIRPRKMQLQLAYVHNHSFWRDLAIAWETFRAIVGCESTQDLDARFAKLLRKATR